MSFKFHFKLTILLLLMFIVPIDASSLSVAQKTPNPDSKTTPETPQNESSPLQLPARGSPMGRRRGGTSRNNCPPLEPPLTALVPGKEEETQSDSYLATTISENPSFWFYVPKLPEQVQTGEFILQTEAGEDLERTQIKLPATEGAIAITLTSSPQSSLAVGEKYHWYFKIYCGEPIPGSDYSFVDGWIERIAISPELETQLQTSDKADYLIYRDRQIWYDALTSLGKRLQTNPNENQLQTDWGNLLQSVDLSHLGNLSVVKIYQLE
ncbi:MAG: DUF928 domain-containing protein [Pleurocapsa sp. MO_226.B13]|nr:DUF928 domain-containing protein [Pleurocapsa sp. MO_226.B13]